MSEKKEMMTFVGPAWAWETIWETINADLQSGAFDYDLRVEIQAAKNAVEKAIMMPDTQFSQARVGPLPNHNLTVATIYKFKSKGLVPKDYRGIPVVLKSVYEQDGEWAADCTLLADVPAQMRRQGNLLSKGDMVTVNADWLEPQ